LPKPCIWKSKTWRNSSNHENLAPQGENSLSLNTIRGGTFINVVPDRCHIEVDCRYAPGTDTEKALQRLHALLQEQPDCELEILAKLPAFAAQAASPLLATLQTAMQQFGIAPQAKQEPWFADAAFFARAGCDTLIWGAGDIARAHTEEEFIEIEQVEKATAILRAVIRRVHNGKSLAKMDV